MDDLSSMFTPIRIFNKSSGYVLFDELKNFKRDVQPILTEYSWFLSPTLNITLKYYIFKNITKQSDVEFFLNKVFVYYFSVNDFDNLDYLVGRWAVYSTVGDRFSILEECVNILRDSTSGSSNIKNPHYVIIPTLIAQIDGLKSDIVEQYKSKKVNEETKGNKRISEKKCISEILENIYNSKSCDPDYSFVYNWLLEESTNANDLLFDVLFQPAQRTDKIEELKPPFSRHKIMHGQHLEYANMENTIRLFLLIDFLAELNYHMKKGLSYDF